MRTELFFPSEATEERKDEVRTAFARHGASIDLKGKTALKALEVVGVRIDAAFVAQTVVGGLAFEAGRVALERGLAALREVWQESGTVVLDAGDGVPTVYYVPDGPEGEIALDAIATDAGATGQRLWLPGVGWRSMDEIDRIQAESVLAPDTKTPPDP